MGHILYRVVALIGPLTALMIMMTLLNKQSWLSWRNIRLEVANSAAHPPALSLSIVQRLPNHFIYLERWLLPANQLVPPVFTNMKYSYVSPPPPFPPPPPLPLLPSPLISIYIYHRYPISESRRISPISPPNPGLKYASAAHNYGWKLKHSLELLIHAPSAAGNAVED